MKKFFFASLFCCVCCFAQAQWQTSGTNVYYSGGKVGIGTSTPSQTLSVIGTTQFNGVSDQTVAYTRISWNAIAGTGASTFDNHRDLGNAAFVFRTTTGTNPFTEVMRINASGNMGIGTTSPIGMLHIKGNSSDGTFTFETANGNSRWQLASIQSTANLAFIDVLNSTAPLVINKGAPNNTLTLSNSGNILIGKNNQPNTTYKLDVSGSARMDKVVVNTTGADFVFDSSYQLKSLNHVENYIKQNHHLPEIESAQQMQENGVDLGSNQAKLLQKVEELTLYIIEQQKQIKKQQEKLYELEQELNLLKIKEK